MKSGAVETEIKLRMADAAAGRAAIERTSARPKSERLFEANVVYDTPFGEVRARGELLRVRETGGRCVLTWKGPAVSGPHKSREEAEVAVSDCAELARILHGLGYAPAFRYEKYRTEFALDEGTITLDETPIGCFVELEGAPEWIDRVAAQMGFGTTDYVTSSYGTLYREYCAASGVVPSGMVFTLDR